MPVCLFIPDPIRLHVGAEPGGPVHFGCEHQLMIVVAGDVESGGCMMREYRLEWRGKGMYGPGSNPASASLRGLWNKMALIVTI